MQSRFSSESVFRKASIYVPKKFSKETQCVTELFRANELKKFAYLELKKKKQIKNAAEIIRRVLLEALEEAVYPSNCYTIIYDALRLLAHCFPCNAPSDENKQHVECPITLTPLNNKLLRYIAADGFWFSFMGISQLLRANRQDENGLLIHPCTIQHFTQEDIRRIKLFAASLVSTKTQPLVDKYTLLHMPIIWIGGYIGEWIALQFATVNSPLTQTKKSTGNQYGVNIASVLFLLSMAIRYQYLTYKHHQANLSAQPIFDEDPQKKLFFDSLLPLISTESNSLLSIAYKMRYYFFTTRSMSREEKNDRPAPSTSRQNASVL